jgi:peptidoglycan/LPS O-acetylase OafA/YrhL
MPIRIKELDALRGIAALGVVFFHYTLGRPQAQLGFNLGITGVDLFFMISGFVIFMSIQNIHSGLEFVVNRFTRLYPTYWTCVTLTAILQLVLIINSSENWFDLSLSKYIVNLTMFQHYFKVNDIDGSYWTMIIEMEFYLFILLLIVSRQIKHITLISMILVVTIGLYSIFLEKQFPTINELINYWVRLFAHFPLFVAGIAFYKIKQHEGKWFTNYLIIALCFVVQASLYNNSTKASSFISFNEYVMMLSIYFLVFILIAHQKLKYIASKPLLFLGKISFALYLIHQFMSNEIIIPLVLNHIIQNFWIAAIIALIVSLSLASVITYCIEIPVGKKLNKVLRYKLKLPSN